MRTRSEINSTEWFGHIPNGWEMRPIKALFRFSKGLSITNLNVALQSLAMGRFIPKTMTGQALPNL